MSTPSEPADTVDQSNGRDTLLLVDDDINSLQSLAATVEGEPLRVLISRSGEEALKVASREQPTLVLLDIMMPGIDGFEVCQRLMADPRTRSCAVIFLSGLDDTQDKVRGLQLGAVDYITKPFVAGEVLARVRTHLTIARLRRRLALRNQELEFENRHILESMGEGLYCLDINGHVTYANPAAARLTGWDEEQLIGRHVSELYHNFDAAQTAATERCGISQTLASGMACRSDDEHFMTRSGGSIPVECSCTPLDENSKQHGAVLVFRDISERLQQQAELNAALTEVGRLKDRLQAEKLYLMDEIRSERNFGEIVGESSALLQVLEQVAQVASTETTVLIQGESGTGKEAIARAIHDLSPRRERPLIKVNCAAFSPSLVESELFGHEKGAFTGALRARAGHFELADGGTIFLDEFGELSSELQVKMLRVLQEREIQRVGAESSIHVDVRIIAATNRDLRAMVDAGDFRLDLYYRMSVFPVTLPPLRERPSDIPLLVAEFLKRLSNQLGRRFDGISQGSMEALVAYPWPGNIRELQNVIERAAILSTGSVVKIDRSMLTLSDAQQDPAAPPTSTPTAPAPLLSLADAERDHIRRVLEACNGVVGGRDGAAAILDLPDSTLRSRMKKLGIATTKRPPE